MYIYILSARILNQWWLLAHHNLPPITMCLSKQIRHSVSFPFIKTVPYGSIRKCLHREPWLNRYIKYMCPSKKNNLMYPSSCLIAHLFHIQKYFGKPLVTTTNLSDPKKNHLTYLLCCCPSRTRTGWFPAPMLITSSG